ncbi:hypothetical protein H0H93_007504 [Arthromyces matolae]|nr:hypothetical protein H0H93_007504 [Arthromyces matolae]
MNHIFRASDLRQVTSDLLADVFKRLDELDEKNQKAGKATTHAVDPLPHFMTIVDDWCVRHNSVEDTTTFTREKATITENVCGSQRSGLSVRDSQQNATPTDVGHVRTVFEEVCQSINEITNYATMIKVLGHTIQALIYLRLAGYAHRDVSAGNCLWDIKLKGEMEKVSDLEYARPSAGAVGYDPLTGTPAFMAAEYLRGSYLFMPTANTTRKAVNATRGTFFDEAAGSDFGENLDRKELLSEPGSLRDLREPLKVYEPTIFTQLVDLDHSARLLGAAYTELEVNEPESGLWGLEAFDIQFYTDMREEMQAFLRFRGGGK